jgi:hypothetical protein
MRQPFEKIRIDALPQAAPNAKEAGSQRPEPGLAWRKRHVCRVLRAELTGNFLSLNRELFPLNRELFSASRAFFDGEQEAASARTLIAGGQRPTP